MKAVAEKVVIITGGSSGIGLSCAKYFGRKGYAVSISGRNEKNLNAAVEQLTKSGINAIGIVGDVSKEEDCKNLIAKTVSEFGRIDILINNAGISMRAMFNDVELSVIRQIMEINFFGTLYCTKYAMPELLKTKGSLVGISSIAGFQGLPGRTGYSASKFAMQGFMNAIRVENHKTGLHVLTVCPGYTESNIRNAALTADGSAQGSRRDEKKMMSSDEVAAHIYKAILDRKRNIVLTAQGKLAHLLSKLFPKFVDKMVYKAVSKERDWKMEQ